MLLYSLNFNYIVFEYKTTNYFIKNSNIFLIFNVIGKKKLLISQIFILFDNPVMRRLLSHFTNLHYFIVNLIIILKTNSNDLFLQFFIIMFYKKINLIIFKIKLLFIRKL